MPYHPLQWSKICHFAQKIETLMIESVFQFIENFWFCKIVRCIFVMWLTWQFVNCRYCAALVCPTRHYFVIIQFIELCSKCHSICPMQHNFALICKYHSFLRFFVWNSPPSFVIITSLVKYHIICLVMVLAWIGIFQNSLKSLLILQNINELTLKVFKNESKWYYKYVMTNCYHNSKLYLFLILKEKDLKLRR